MPYLLLPAIFLLVVVVLLTAVHTGFRAPRRRERTTPARLGLNYEALSIETRGGKRLHAWWLPAQKPSRRSILLLHGWGGNSEFMLPLAVPLHRAGFNALLLDARNHGRSDSAGYSSMPRFAEDAGAAIDWLRSQRPDQAGGIALLGHSVGAAAVLLEASRRNDIDAVISIAAFAHPEWMMRRYLARLHLPRWLLAVVLRYVEWVIGHRYDDIAPLNTVCRIRCPLLLVHGTADHTVPVSDALAIRDHCRHERLQLYLVEGADHESVDAVEAHADRLIGFLDDTLPP
ncbi:MAG TPA: alpha/beta fold hydrolase [Gammaproteobacteria bacterium]|nr:alpha/beta fold hydrolase [Gammaproteobacteria bacterium]